MSPSLASPRATGVCIDPLGWNQLLETCTSNASVEFEQPLDELAGMQSHGLPARYGCAVERAAQSASSARTHILPALARPKMSHEAGAELTTILKTVNIVFSTPVCLVSLFGKGGEMSDLTAVMEGTQQGAGGSGTHPGAFLWRDWRWATCGWGVYEGPRPQSVLFPDTATEARFMENVHVTSASAWVRFFFSMPIVSSTGRHLGTLCVLDAKPHELQSNAHQVMANLALLVARHLEKTVAGRATPPPDKNGESLRRAFRLMESALNIHGLCLMVLDTSKPGYAITYRNKSAWLQLTGLAAEDMGSVLTLSQLLAAEGGEELPQAPHQHYVSLHQRFKVDNATLKVGSKAGGKRLQLVFRPIDGKGVDSCAHGNSPASRQLDAASSLPSTEAFCPLYFLAVSAMPCQPSPPSSWGSVGAGTTPSPLSVASRCSLGGGTPAVGRVGGEAVPCQPLADSSDRRRSASC